MTTARSPISFIATSDPDKALAFYRDVLELQLLEASPYALVFRDADTMLRVQIVPELRTASHTVHGWQVDDIAHNIAELTTKGVTFLTFEQLEQDATGVWTTPEDHKVAWFNDPSGNILSLTEFARS